MKKKIIILLIVFLIPLKINAISDTARSTIVMDIDSGRILYQKNANEKRLIASTTKIMTAIIAIENSDINKEITVGEEVLSMYGSNIYIELNERITIKNLLYGLLLRSGNDAAVVIAKNVGGSVDNFVKMMNLKAKEIGMKNTVFKNPHGLDEQTQNYSTAYDMALLSAYSYKIKEYREISGTKKWEVKSDKKSYIWNNRNKLLFTYPYTTSGKTGYTPSAGRTLVTTASNGDLNLTVVTLKDANEYITHQSLFNYYFENYKNYLILDKKNFNYDKNIIKQKLYIKNNFIYPLSNKEKKQIKILLKINKTSNTKNNDKVGKLYVYLKEKEIYNTDIYVEVNSKKSIFYRIKKWLKDL